MQQIQLIKLFISCPSDVKEEVNSIGIIVEEINKTFGRQNAFSLQILNWSKDVYTQVGEDAQDVINTQLDPYYDILIGILWQKIGTPTKRDKSGTIEEINRAIDNNSKELLVYFKTTPPENLNDLDLNQVMEVRLFKQSLSEKGLFYKEFNSTASFESLFRIHLTNLISDKLLKVNRSIIAHSVETRPKRYEEIATIIEEVELKKDNANSELDVFELVENVTSSFNSVTTCIESMATILHDISQKMNIKTEELNKLIHIKDNKLRIEKSQIVVNILAGELMDFNRRMDSEKQILVEHFLNIGPKYSLIMQFQEAFKASQEINLRKILSDYRDSVEGATQQSANMLKIISNWPPFNSKFNKSKRETEVTIKDITKIFLEGLQLLDEALEK